MTKKTQKVFSVNQAPVKAGGYGKQFEGEILDALKRENPYAWSQRIADKVGNIRRGNRRFGAKTPADMIVCAEWADLLFECKSTTGTSLAFNMLKPHQFRWLKKFNRVSNHHIGCVVIMFGRLPKELMTGSVARRAFIVDVRTWNRLKRDYNKGIRKNKSINRAELFDGSIPCIELEWRRGSGWYIGKLKKKEKEGLVRYEY